MVYTSVILMMQSYDFYLICASVSAIIFSELMIFNICVL